MTTSTEQIVDLIDSNRELTEMYRLKAGQIDQRVQQMLPDLGGALRRSIYINANTGDDDATGYVDTPVRSFDGAAKLMLAGGTYTTYLQTDIVHSTRTVLPCASLNIFSATLDVKQRLDFAAEISPDDTRAPCFEMEARSTGIYMRDITVGLSQASGHVTRKSAVLGGTHLAMQFWRCDLDPAAGADIALFGGGFAV